MIIPDSSVAVEKKELARVLIIHYEVRKVIACEN
jgi:hypothetical protein